MRKNSLAAVLPVAAALLLVSALAAPAPAQDASEASAEAPKEKLICRADKATGSRVRVNRVCLTREQWAAVDEKKRQSLNELGRSGSVSPCGPGSQAGGCNPAPNPMTASPF